MPVDAEALKKFADEELVRLNAQRDEAIKDLERGYSWSVREATLYWDNFLESLPFISRSESMTARGGLPFMPKLKVGENLIVLEPELPTDTEDQNKNARKRFVARVMGNKERYAWNVNPRSPMYRELLTALTASPCVLRIIRVGEGQTDTRYDVKFERKLGAGE